MDAQVEILETHSEAGRFQTDKLRPLPQAYQKKKKEKRYNTLYL